MAYKKRSYYKKPSTNNIKTIVIGIIIAAMVAVILAIITMLMNKPENITKSKIETMARDYYENYFYKDITTPSLSDTQLEKVMKKYEETGFTRVELRILLLFDNQKYRDSADFIKSHCDTDLTTVQFFPDAPYGQKDYHIVYDYSCDF